MTIPAIFAHRGASADAPENTIAAFETAISQRADGVELDVRRTRDGELVVCHDATLGDGRVVGDMFHDDVPTSIPTLDAALDACGDLVVNVEIKNLPPDPDFDESLDIAEQVADALAGRDAGRLLVSSFHPRTLIRFAEHSDIPVGLLTMIDPSPMDAVGIAARRGWVAIHPHDATVDEALVAAAHEAGVAVNVWTVDDPARIRQLADLGVDAVITNVPAIARDALG